MSKTTKLEGSYSPQLVEPGIQEKNRSRESFKAGAAATQSSDAYCISLPPPNVTGSLHMGHALNHTLQDILIRYKRMTGTPTLWQPGTDHAGIATQMVVERQLAEKGTSRGELGREKFEEAVWTWKEESGNTIVDQQKRLGESCDWSRQRFTLDEGLSAAVRKVFVELHKEGLIYRDKRLVNWDPKFQTAISDLEVIQKETKGSMWRMRYPLAEDPSRWVTVATTRPETMFGDTAVAVHPEDERYTDLIGTMVTLPLTGRTIPIIADEYSDPEKGTGAVKITPAHDFNDFEVGKRNGLDMIDVMTEVATMNENCPEEFQGLDRFKARKLVLSRLEELGLLEGEDENDMTVPYGDRSGVVIEPRLTDQWFVDAHTLAQPAIAAVENGDTEFAPKHWEKTYFEWMRNIQPWCISRQLWWGHRIPAWFGPDGHIFVDYSLELAAKQAEEHYGESVVLAQDTDVLDTWFSSALWPFSTLGWPETTAELGQYYPNSVLVTGFDIIFFWVARMMMMGLKFMGEVPFKTVYIHALVRDEHGNKMSKSKGNVIDPLVVIDEHGADALRFTLTSMAAMGRDIKLSLDRVEGYKQFGNKIWNAIKFCQMQEGFDSVSGDAPSPQSDSDHWIQRQLELARATVQTSLESYRFNDLAQSLYSFIWSEFCDWYIECLKVSLRDESMDRAQQLNHLKWVVRQWLLLLEPIMPYLCEHIWDTMFDEDICTTAWNHSQETFDQDRAQAFAIIQDLVSAVRTARTENNFAPGAKITLLLDQIDDQHRDTVQRNQAYVRSLAKIGEIEFAELQEAGIREQLPFAVLGIPFGDSVDVSAEIQRIEKEVSKIDKELQKIQGKLSNQNFLAKAPESVVEKNKLEAQQLSERKATLTSQSEKLKAL